MRFSCRRCVEFLIKPRFFGPPRPSNLPRAFTDAAFQEFCESRVEDDPFHFPRRVETPTSTNIDALVEFKVSKLAEGAFKFRIGPQSNLIVGERGIGKTDSLRRAAIRAGCRYENVLPIYVEYSEKGEPTAPSSLIVEAMQQRGVSVEMPPRGNLQSVLELLADHKLYVLLLADEFDQLFCYPADHDGALHTIWEYNAIGCSNMGRVAPILCGSSGTLPLLISGKGRQKVMLGEAFPISTRTPDMNGSKYESVRVSQGQYSSKAVADVMQHFFPNHSDAMKMAFYFLAGSNLRHLDKLATHQKPAICRDEWALRASDAWDKYKPMISEFDDALYQLNSEIVAPVVKAKTNAELWTAVSNTDWVTAVKGLEKEAQRQIWKKHGHSEADLQYLIDKGWFFATPSHLFPGKPSFLLVNAIIKKESLLLATAKKTGAFTAKLLKQAAQGGAGEAGAQLVQGVLEHVMGQ